MSIRLRTVNGARVAVCAARSIEKPGDLYLDDGDHHALAQKFLADFVSERLIVDDAPIDVDEAAVREAEESNNPNRTWWDQTYDRVRAVPVKSSRAERDAAQRALDEERRRSWYQDPLRQPRPRGK